MRARLPVVALAGLAGLAGLAAARAQAAPPAPPTGRLVVGVTDSPPLAYQGDDGAWTGLAVATWEEIAARLGRDYEFRPLLLDEVGAALAARRIDLAIGAIAVTPAGEAAHDYSQPFLVTGLGFAQRRQETVPWDAVGRALLDPRLVSVLSAIIGAMLVVGVIIALIERGARASDFAGSLRESVSMGVWWAAVTMTTVGYGDATPKTTTGRALALVWMFVGVVAVAILTATATTVLTVAHLRGAVERPADLLRLRLGAVDGGAGAEYLGHHRGPFTTYPTYEEALTALDAGAVDAVVGGIPILRSLVSRSWAGRLQVSPITLKPVLYAVALPENSPLTSRIDLAVLAVTHDDRWAAVEERFLGRH
jgi:ABC-type amino acid transport substrate-binding protein